MRPAPLLLAFVALLTACAGEASFYSFPSHAFVPFGQVPARRDLLGTWRRNDGRDLVFRPDGKFSSGTAGGCWDVDAGKLLLRPGCVNYGAQEDSIIFAIAEATHGCSFQLSGHLVLRDCIYAAEYSRDKDPGTPLARR